MSTVEELTRTCAPPPRIDVHQHLWSEPLVAALARRRRAPRLLRSSGSWLLQLDGEPEVVVEPEADRGDERTALLDADEIDRALICISSPLGIEALPADEAWPLIDAYHAGVAALLPGRFGAWGAVTLDDPDPRQVDDLLARGLAGISLPAGALATPAALERVGPLLARLEHWNAPLLVHPGPAPWARRAAGADLPPWWPAMTTYVAEQSAAWHAFAARGRAAHPSLRVVFAMLAGGAPLHAERLVARGGPAGALDDPRIFYDTSSYGARAIEAVAAIVGHTQLVHGSDRPVVAPSSWASALPRDRRQAVLADNTARLLGRALTLA